LIYANHLNTPRLVADVAGTTVWRWDLQEPFGNNVADENPSALGLFDLPLRLPGQYFDTETGLHYSYFRDCYDSGTGRFCQPDPAGTVMFGDLGLRSLGAIGLLQPQLGGLMFSERPKYNHLYSYAQNNPLSFTDPTGLLSTQEMCLQDVWCTLIVPVDNGGVCLYLCDDGTMLYRFVHATCKKRVRKSGLD
jgi:RHS repeat-associated protein